MKIILNVKIYYFWIYYVIIFERFTWNKWIYFSSYCLHYLVVLSDIQINISSTLLHVLTSWVENFKSILNLNLLTQLKYSSWIFWFNLNTQVKNSDLNQVLTSQVLNLNSSTWLNVINLCDSLNLSCLFIEILTLAWWKFEVANHSCKREWEMRDKEDTWSANQERKDWVFSSMSWFISLWKLLKINEKS